MKGFKILFSKQTYNNISYLMAVVFLILSIVFIKKDIYAKTFFVTDSRMFLSALKEASTNKEDDIIKIAKGVQTPKFSTVATEIGFSLTLEAGYSTDFSSRMIRQAPPDVPIIPGRAIPQQSTAGPEPPENVERISSSGQVFTGQQGGTQKTIGVPAYRWRHGCGPTALGMVLGYYDVNGFADLFVGSASTQTIGVNQGIASQRNISDPGHYEDYSLPIDSGQPTPLPDKSELPQGDEHTNDSIADYMKTSFSSENNYYGWSWSSDIAPAFLGYVAMRHPRYQTATSLYYKSNNTLSWSVLTRNINNNRPMVFLVDTDADGYTDHFVTVVGYRDDVNQQYGCLDTWDPVATVRWCNFATMSIGQPWGIWGGWSFDISDPTTSNLTPLFHLLLQE